MSEVSQDIATFLLERNIGYIRHTHKPIFTVDDGRDIAEHLGIEPCKTLLLVNRKSQYYMLLTKGDGKISLTGLARQLGSSRLSLASTEALDLLLHATPGAASPLGLIFDSNHMVGLCIDKVILQQKYIMVHPCVNNESYVFTSSDFFNHFLSAVNCREFKVIDI